jgi:DNA-binding FadR family transcriptional regulator
MSGVARPAAPPKMAEHIAAQIRGRIVRRELNGGDFLPVESELCELFDTSRPTMREAFRILETEGLIRIRRGGRRGPQVLAPDAAVTARSLGLLLQYQDVDLGEVYDAFLEMVPLAAGRLAQRHLGSDVERLRSQRERCVNAGDDPGRFLDEATGFNLLIVELAGDRVQALLCRLLAEVVSAHRRAISAYFESKPNVRAKRTTDVLDSTATVIDMIVAGDMGVTDYLRAALGSVQQKALGVRLDDPIQIV